MFCIYSYCIPTCCWGRRERGGHLGQGGQGSPIAPTVVRGAMEPPGVSPRRLSAALFESNSQPPRQHPPTTTTRPTRGQRRTIQGHHKERTTTTDITVTLDSKPIKAPPTTRKKRGRGEERGGAPAGEAWSTPWRPLNCSWSSGTRIRCTPDEHLHQLSNQPGTPPAEAHQQHKINNPRLPAKISRSNKTSNNK